MSSHNHRLKTIGLIISSSFFFAWLIISLTQESTAMQQPRETASLASTYIPLAEIAFDIDNFVDAVMDYDSNRIYISYSRDGIVAIDATSLEILEQIETILRPEQITLNATGSTLFVSSIDGNSDNIITVVDVATFAVVDSFPFHDDILDMAVGPGERLYVTPSRNHDAAVYVMDSNNGDVLSTIPVGDQTSEEFPVVIVGDTLYTTLALKGGSEGELQKYDVSEITATQILTSFLPTGALRMTAAPDNSTIAILDYQERDLRFFDPNTLTETAQVENGPGYHNIWFADDSQSLLAIYWTGGNIGPAGIHQVDPVTAAITRTFLEFDDTQRGYYAIPLANEDALLVGKDRTKYLRAANYGAALPMMMNVYCTGNFTDDFSDPSSGWPISTGGATTLEYLNGEYRIAFTDPGRWTGVTLSHPMNGGETVELEGRLTNTQAGVWGFIFGLNNDGSNFYTIEILPYQQEWVHLNFNSNSGWSLISSGSTGAIQSGTATNRLRLEAHESGYVFYINNVDVATFTPRNGRVGFSGASLAPAVDIRYDNYLFAGDNCPTTPLSPLNSLISLDQRQLGTHPLFKND